MRPRVFAHRRNTELCSFALVLFLVSLSAPDRARASDQGAWRASQAVEAPDWFAFGLNHRTRVELLQDDFRRSATGDPRAVSLRTLGSVDVTAKPFCLRLELIDSRAFANDEAAINTTVVDVLDLLELHAGAALDDLFFDGDHARVTVGRLTLDVGSRRLIARNAFRNTINSFSGMDAAWTGKTQGTLRMFAAVPVDRRPSDRDSLDDGSFELDRENTDALVAGLYYTSPELGSRFTAEGSVIGLAERDGHVQSRNRRLVNPSLRVTRGPAVGDYDFEAEVIVQLGTSRASASASDTTDLDHLAWFAHGSFGYTLRAAWRPRVMLQYDYATGDDAPDDGNNERFDTLFGARRWELGPTGIYGAFARSNVSSPGARLQLQPITDVRLLFGYRAFWLASARDAWTTAGLQDPTGASGRFIGHQLELRARYDLVPKNLRLEVGAAYLARGEFAESAPGGSDQASTYLYSQIVAEI